MSGHRRCFSIGRIVFALVFVFIAAAPRAMSATFVWEGDDATSPLDWGTAENWDQGALPGAGDDVLFPNNPNSLPIELNGDRSVTSLSFVDGGPFKILNDTNDTLSVSGDVSASGAGTVGRINSALDMLAGAGTFFVDGPAHMELLGHITGIGSAQSLTKTGAGTLVVSPPALVGFPLMPGNQYSGATRVMDGTLRISGSIFVDSIPDNSALIVDAGAQFVVAQNSTEQFGSLAGDGHVMITNSGSFTFGLDNTDTTFAGSLESNLNVAEIRKVGTGTWTLSGDNSAYLGFLNIESGTVVVSQDMNLGAPSTIVGLANATLRVTASHTTNRTIGSSSLSNIEIDADQTYTIDGPVSANSSLINKQGEGTLILTNDNPMTQFAQVSIDAGTLLVNNSAGSGTGEASVTVNSGGTLGGTGAVENDVTVHAGGTVAPGASTGQLSVGSIDIGTNGGSLVFEIGGLTSGTEHDQLDVTLDADLTAGSIDVTLVNGFVPSAGDQFEIITFDMGSATVDFDIFNLPSLSHLGLGWAPSVDAVTDSVWLDVIAILIGDADGDGDVDLDDFNILASNFGQTTMTGSAFADFDNDGDTDLDDFNLLASNFGVGTESVGSLPEPGAATLLMAGGAGLGRRKRRSAG